MANVLADGVYSDGTGDGGKEIGGLDIAVPTDPTVGTYGGIDRAAFPFWRSQAFDSAVINGGALTAANVQNLMNQAGSQAPGSNGSQFFNIIHKTAAGPSHCIGRPDDHRITKHLSNPFSVFECINGLTFRHFKADFIHGFV